LDCGQNALEIAKNIVIPESQHPVTVLSQTAISHNVRGRSIVLPAVHFDNQKSFPANEIADVTAYGLLSYKFLPIDLSVPNTIPKYCFRVRLI